MKPLTHVTEPAVVKALAHPLRVQILSVLERRLASPSEVAKELDARLGNVAYHMRQLERFGLVRLVNTVPRRGAFEHYYELERPPSVTDEGWARAPGVVKQALSSAAIAQIGAQVASAADAGAFERSDIHLGRYPLVLDEQGFKAAAAATALVVEKLLRIQAASQKRIAGKKTTPVDALAVLMLFEAPEAWAGDSGTKQRPTRRGRGKAKKKRKPAR